MGNSKTRNVLANILTINLLVLICIYTLKRYTVSTLSITKIACDGPLL